MRISKLEPALLWLAVITSFIQITLSVRFNLSPSSRKCLRQEMYENQLAVGEYEISNHPGSIVDVTIKDTKGHTAFNRENIDGKGKFAFTSDLADVYELCFTYHSAPNDMTQLMAREVAVDFKVGAETKHYDENQQDKLIQLENDLAHIKDLTNAIIDDFAHLKKREREMRDTNDSTNNRLFYQTVLSIIILLVLTSWQVLYLRTFFKARKLID